jgi:hypothetical protein
MARDHEAVRAASHRKAEDLDEEAVMKTTMRAACTFLLALAACAAPAAEDTDETSAAIAPDNDVVTWKLDDPLPGAVITGSIDYLKRPGRAARLFLLFDGHYVAVTELGGASTPKGTEDGVPVVHEDFQFTLSDGFEGFAFDAELLIEFGDKPDPFTGADGSPLPLPGDGPTWDAKPAAPVNAGGGARTTITCEIEKVTPGAANTGTYYCTRYCPAHQRSQADWTVSPAITQRSPFGCEDRTNPQGEHFAQCHVEADVGKLAKHVFTVHCQ